MSKTNLAKIKNDREEEVNNSVEMIELKTKSLVTDLRDCMIGFMKELPKLSYDAISEEEQQALADNIEEQCRTMVKAAVEMIAAKEADSLPAKIESLTVKGGLKFVIKAAEDQDSYVIAGRLLHKDVTIVGLSLASFDEIQNAANINPDQSSLLDNENVDENQQEGAEGADGEPAPKRRNKKND